ncbi:Na+/H+ antiporter NhaC family protein [Turicibacter sanguinis]|uniref:Na+/H+ antiporter NhaC family protein n=2 Tax=Turicibacter sanguinis TaxID=154288 RepID=UPI0006BEFF4C|nr:Na+/H+ antiporter NhaC family protein [Turicibacter sanguinis]MCU7212457.1 Na+/H+ antiporter NhaC family protein [Turicibacter sanguinis]MDB8540757.1 Na+/H+ antiporter NhaC family protein [Turicibacter sanguinis]MDB8544231.1 Na+/H+ antiporter NhaC family protein [Turicibacter sanguinis]MDB8574582.1 Na+/H+ antiporter NhaC family protein [Turicibacter sanguinis]MDB8577639.1 Na+/H+ antiporter NhaC family protein [Turicibacter sanguinis]
MNKLKDKGNPWALLPLGLFLVLFVGSGVITGDFYYMPVLVAFMLAAACAFLFNRTATFNEKIAVFCKGAGHENIIMMIVIFLLAGAFSGVAKSIGAVDATVNMSLSVLPPNLVVAGLFIIASFISISMGTSVGTITALTPIGLGIANATGIPVALVVGAVVGGGMFGDNLSMISDTTIAAVRTQGCELKDKFKVNFFIVLPAAIISLILLVVTTMSFDQTTTSVGSFEWIKVLPYLYILVGALVGINVFTLLSSGVLVAGIIGLFTHAATFPDLIQSASSGMAGMQELAIICLIVGGTLELIKFNGGIQFLLHLLTSRIKSKKGAEFAIAGLVSLVDICTANNTIAIVVSGPLAKNIADEYEIDPKRSASLLDIFSSCWQGLIPYGAQLLGAAGLAAISPFEIIPYVHYPMLMGLFGLLAIMFGFPKINKK